MAKTTVKIKSAPKAKAKVVVAPELEVYGDQRFFVINGNILSRLTELPAALKAMDTDTYAYHVNSDKNDFSQWVSDVLGNKALATKLKKAKNKDDMATLIEKNSK